ncbi:snaclec mamushigin subunit alpha [Bombina bombina]|uniref:snaclec mamushigin subunit alpha n=1 Tax=Bombina bombina TaxID=8345 RepID=UPI00235AB3A0|nr:snaclec mamushigin subunit alpha [Bombina bombina]
MMEDITYANLKFQDGHEVGSTRKLDSKEKEDSTLQTKKRTNKCLKPALIIFGLMCLVLLGALLAVIVLFLKVNEREEELKIKQVNLTQALEKMKSEICINKDFTNKGAKCLFCPKGWLNKGSKCYYMSSNKSSWDESQRYCSERNANLWMIKRKEEKSVAKDLYSTACTSLDYLWIGLRTTEKQEWEWIDKTPNTVIDITAPYKQDKCVRLYKCDSDKAFWEDCSKQYVFLCEKKAIELY